MNSVHNNVVIYIVEDDFAVRGAIEKLVNSVGMSSVCCSSAEEFLKNYDEETPGCLVLDVRMNGMSGIELQKILIKRGSVIPIVFITGHGDIPMAVETLKRGAVNFIEKPFRNQELLDSINSAIQLDKKSRDHCEKIKLLMDNYSNLTSREKEVAQLISQGKISKQIADTLYLSPRTIETHRANIMKKMGSSNSFELMKKLIQVGTATDKSESY
tara:strand:+ start:2967 stop:3608 length:642 start_codon:yes stop_codon:yes gene_type:complete